MGEGRGGKLVVKKEVFRKKSCIIRRQFRRLTCPARRVLKKVGKVILCRVTSTDRFAPFVISGKPHVSRGAGLQWDNEKKKIRRNRAEKNGLEHFITWVNTGSQPLKFGKIFSCNVADPHRVFAGQIYIINITRGAGLENKQ